MPEQKNHWVNFQIKRFLIDAIIGKSQLGNKNLIIITITPFLFVI